MTPEFLKLAQPAIDDANVFGQAANAAMAGEPRPDGPPLAQQGWDYGNARRRAAAGEILGFVCPGTQCAACGSQAWGNRLGCHCSDAVMPASIRWGVLVTDPDGPHARFMTCDEVRATGLPLIDLFSGAAVPLPEPDSSVQIQQAQGS